MKEKTMESVGKTLGGIGAALFAAAIFIGGMLAIIAVMVVVNGAVGMWAWNMVAPKLFGLSEANLLESMAVMLLFGVMRGVGKEEQSKDKLARTVAYWLSILGIAYGISLFA